MTTIALKWYHPLFYGPLSEPPPYDIAEYWERLSALYLHGTLTLKKGQKGHDVIPGLLLANRTVQVKWSGGHKHNDRRSGPSFRWEWRQENWDPLRHDYFVLIGRDSAHQVHWFAMTHQTFWSMSSRYEQKGRVVFVEMGRRRSKNAIWNTRVSDPESGLYDYLLHLDQNAWQQSLEFNNSRQENNDERR